MNYFLIYCLFMGVRAFLVANAGGKAINWKYDQENWKELPDAVPSIRQVVLMVIDLRKWTFNQFYPDFKN